MNAPGVGCGLVLLREGRILLVRRRKAPEAGCWSLAGGKVDFLESSADAARRECAEECGISVGEIVLLGMSEQLLMAERQHWLIVAYIASDFRGEPELREPDKHSDLGWFALDALPAPLALVARDAVRLMASPDRPPQRT